MIDADLLKWQTYIFNFGVLFASLFQVDISTKLHHVMRHVTDHIRNLGCLRRGISEEDEESHEHFKILMVNTNRHIDTMDAQLLTVWVDRFEDRPPIVDDDND